MTQGMAPTEACEACDSCGFILATTKRGLEIQRCDTCNPDRTDDDAARFAYGLAREALGGALRPTDRLLAALKAVADAPPQGGQLLSAWEHARGVVGSIRVSAPEDIDRESAWWTVEAAQAALGEYARSAENSGQWSDDAADALSLSSRINEYSHRFGQ